MWSKLTGAAETGQPHSKSDDEIKPNHSFPLFQIGKTPLGHFVNK